MSDFNTPSATDAVCEVIAEDAEPAGGPADDLDDVLGPLLRQATLEDESTAPAVDDGLIRKWIRREASADENLTVAENVTRFPSWRRAAWSLAKEESRSQPKDDDTRQELFSNVFGVDAPQWLDEQGAPPLDEDLVRRFVRSETTASENLQLFALVASFKSWADFAAEIAAEESLKRRSEGED